jgi:hypothetical protein
VRAAPSAAHDEGALPATVVYFPPGSLVPGTAQRPAAELIPGHGSWRIYTPVSGGGWARITRTHACRLPSWELVRNCDQEFDARARS